MVQKRGPKPVPKSRTSGLAKLQAVPTRYQQYVDGSLTAADLTLDELTRGKLMDRNGNFSGQYPAIMPSGLQSAMIRELQKRMNDRFRNHAFDAIDKIVEVMETGEGEQVSQFQKRGTGQFKAAQYIVERIIGKIPNEMNINQNTTVWEGVQESQGLFVDVEVDEIIPYQEEPVSEQEQPRRRGPRTQPKARRNPRGAED